MKKCRIGLILLLCALLLCSCTQKPAPTPEPTPAPSLSAAHGVQTPAPTAAPEATPAPTEAPLETVALDDGTPRFSEMVYERPDLSELDRLIEAAEAAMNGGSSYAETEPLLDEVFAFYDHYDTMYTLADIRSCLDQTDEYYADEYLWCSENYTLADEAIDGLYYACAASPLGQELEDKYFWEGFCEDYADEEDSIYNETTVALMQEESSLVAEYRALSADPIVSFRGSETPLSELLETLSGMDYNDAVLAYYDQYNAQFADLFIRLVAVREKLAAELGYASYEEMAYEDTFSRDYTPEQAEAYLQDIRTHMVPLYLDLSASSVPYRLRYPSLDEQRLREIVRTSLGDFGGRVTEAYDFMIRHELCDLKRDSRKADMSFETYLIDYSAPFLFVNARGDISDILTLAHEFGHYSDAYVNEAASETIDLAEVYSQGMEYLVLTRLGEQLSEDEVENLARIKMVDTVEMYIQQASFAEFEHRVYALGSENLSAGKLNEIALQLSKDYGYHVPGFDGFFANVWMDIPHYYEQAFYVISYPVSNDVAMQILALERAEPGAGLQRYLDNLERDFSDLTGLVEAGGFESPFDPGRMEKIAATAREILGLGAPRGA